MKQTPEHTVLVVDDAETSLDLLTRTLSDLYEIAVATDGESALAAVQEELPDLILLDVMMPGMDGYEVCHRLKADQRTRDVPVIFLTALGDVADETRGFDLGAVDYITKPISPSVVRARVRTQLTLALQREQLKQQNTELLEAARLKEDVDHMMRHDLRGSLGCVVALPQLIADLGGLSPKQTKFLGMIEESGYRLLNMINLSLGLLQMERGTYPFQPVPVDLLGIAHKVADEWSGIVRSGKLSVAVRVDGRPATGGQSALAAGEELLCYSMLSNLFKNAVEAAPEGSTVSIDFRRASGLSVAIHNEGAVPVELRETFFQKYATAGKVGGTGLGTYSARLIAETQGGSIALDTSEVGGTTVTVNLPADDDDGSRALDHSLPLAYRNASRSSS